MTKKNTKVAIPTFFFTSLFLISVFCFIGRNHAKNLPPTEKQVLTTLANFQRKPAKTPNIYIFITHNEKDDQIYSHSLPFLSSVKTEDFSKSIFSLYHAEAPQNFKYRNTLDWTTGSAPLRLLVKLGYKIHVLSTLMLYQENVEELVFGKNHHLTKSFTLCINKEKENGILTSFENTLQEQIHSNQKNCFAIFLKSNQESAIEKFISNLKKQNLYDDSIIVKLLNPEKKYAENKQTLHVKLGTFKEALLLIEDQDPNKKKHPLANSYEEVFPTILHYLFEDRVTNDFLSGRSDLYSPLLHRGRKLAF